MAPFAYLDHAATTPMLPEAVDALVQTLGGAFGNPSGSHSASRRARTALDSARDRFAASIGAQPREIVFTSGGTEALNLALGGAGGRGVTVWSAVEHDAVRNTVAAFAAGGRGPSRELPVDTSGVLDLSAVGDLLDPSVTAVAVMAVNNEVGSVQPIAELAEMVRRLAPEAVLIVDAVQALPWLDLRPIVAVADLVAISAHKFGGPKGTGALVVREGVAIEPTVFGGGQERDRRSGTQNVAGAVAMAVAAEMTDTDRPAVVSRVAALRDRLVDGLLAIPGLTETSPRNTKVAGNAHVCVEGVESEEMLVLLDRAGVCASAGSACASGAVHASPVLLAMGIAKERALGSLRLTLGRASTDADVDLALEAIPAVVERLRA